MRLQKFLSRAGVASRRKSEGLISAGRVRVDGEVVTRLGTRVDPEAQRVEVDGREVDLLPTEWLALHKPPGATCTRDDQRGRRTVYDLLPPEKHHLFHVGRLDFMSEGLLLLTNAGDLAHRLLHPGSEVQRHYVVGLVGPVPAGVPERLRAGIELEDGPAAAAAASWRVPPDTGAPELQIVLEEGRNREIRRLLAALDIQIRWLRRVGFGPIRLGALPPGEWRRLDAEEVRALERAGTPRDTEGDGRIPPGSACT